MKNIKWEYLYPILGITLMQLDPDCGLTPREEMWLLVYHIACIVFIMSGIGIIITL